MLDNELNELMKSFSMSMFILIELMMRKLGYAPCTLCFFLFPSVIATFISYNANIFKVNPHYIINHHVVNFLLLKLSIVFLYHLMLVKLIYIFLAIYRKNSNWNCICCF